MIADIFYLATSLTLFPVIQAPQQTSLSFQTSQNPIRALSFLPCSAFQLSVLFFRNLLSEIVIIAIICRWHFIDGSFFKLFINPLSSLATT